MKRSVDAVILGGGAAGLAAARALSQAGKTAVVVEARGRLGGRIFTMHDQSSPLPVELGAEFIHGEAQETLALTRAGKLLVAELPDHHLWSRKGVLSPVPGFWEKIDEVRRDIARTFKRSGKDRSFADFLAKTRLPSERRQMSLHFVEGYHAANPGRISARSLAAGDEEARSGANQQYRILEGYDALIHVLEASLDPDRIELRLNTIASELRWKRRRVTLLCRSLSGASLQPISARAAIITLPLGVLKGSQDWPAGFVFSPALEDKNAAMEKLEMGQVFKMVLRFRERFWEKQDLAFLHSRDAPITTFWTSDPIQVPMLTAWAGGPRAETLLNESEPARVDRVLDSVATVFGVPRRNVEEQLDSAALHDWRSDPFSRGAYSYVAVGGGPSQAALARPIDHTLFFAGEATTAEQTGTVAGAIESGQRAARELLRAFRN